MGLLLGSPGCVYHLQVSQIRGHQPYLFVRKFCTSSSLRNGHGAPLIGGRNRARGRGDCFDLAGARGKLSVEDTQGGVGSSDYRGEPQERRFPAAP